MIIERTDKFIKIIAEDGMKLTTFDITTDPTSDDWADYTSFTVSYCPLTTDTSIYKEISMESDAVYQEYCIEAIKRKEEEEHEDPEAEA